MIIKLVFGVIVATVLGSSHTYAGGGSEQIPGWKIMSSKERSVYKAKIHQLESDAEKQHFQQDHSKRMRQRAKEMGVPSFEP